MSSAAGQKIAFFTWCLFNFLLKKFLHFGVLEGVVDRKKHIYFVGLSVLPPIPSPCWPACILPDE
jgi:hypothetical protein